MQGPEFFGTLRVVFGECHGRVTVLGVLEGVTGGAEGYSELPASGDKIPRFLVMQVCLPQKS